MRQFFKKLGFRRMDEMERFIVFKAQRNSYLFLILSLFVWTLYESYKVYAYHTTLNPFPCFLLATATCIQTFSSLIMTRNAVKDDEDSYETRPLMKIVLGVGIVMAILLTVGTAFLFAGVPS